MLPSCTIGNENRAFLKDLRVETKEERELSDQLFNLTNYYRKRNQKNTLEYYAPLKPLAMENSIYIGRMSELGHSISPIAHKGAKQRKNITQTHFRLSIAENIVWYRPKKKDLAYKMFKTLLNSPPHKAAIDSTRWDKMGISIAKSKNGYYIATQIFGESIPK